MKPTRALTIGELAPYIPHKLELLDLRNSPARGHTCEISAVLKTSPWHGIVGVLDEEDKAWKPILRPMEQMIEEIEFEGKKFIPIMELAFIALEKIWTYRPDNDMTKSTELADDHGNGWGCILETKDDYRIGFTLEMKDEWKEFQLSINDSKHMMIDQFALYDMLFKWHFDVFGLIDQGLAVSITEEEILLPEGVLKIVKD